MCVLLVLHRITLTIDWLKACMGVSYAFVTCCARRGSIHRQYERHKDVHSCCIKAMSKHQATFVRSGTDNGGLLLMAIMALKNTAYDLKYHLYVKTRGNHFVAMFYARIKTNNRVSYDKYHPNPPHIHTKLSSDVTCYQMLLQGLQDSQTIDTAMSF